MINDAEIFDAHCHAWAHWPYLPEAPDPEWRGSAESLLWEMDRAEVARAVIICASIGRNPDNNAYAVACAERFPGRFVPFVDVASRWSATHHTPGAAARLEAIVERFQPRGVTHYTSGLGP